MRSNATPGSGGGIPFYDRFVYALSSGFSSNLAVYIFSYYLTFFLVDVRGDVYKRQPQLRQQSGGDASLCGPASSTELHGAVVGGVHVLGVAGDGSEVALSLIHI